MKQHKESVSKFKKEDDDDETCGARAGSFLLERAKAWKIRISDGLPPSVGCFSSSCRDSRNIHPSQSRLLAGFLSNTCFFLIFF